MKIRIAGLINDSIVDGPGIRYTIFMQGCYHNCSECHNPMTHDINGGYLEDIEVIVQQALKNPLLSGVTLTGGEPFLQVDGCLTLIEEFHKLNLDVIIYTGFVYEELLALNNQKITQILTEADYLIDGLFIKEMKTLAISYIGSKNQRIIDLKKSNSLKVVTTDFSDYIIK